MSINLSNHSLQRETVFIEIFRRFSWLRKEKIAFTCWLNILFNLLKVLEKIFYSSVELSQFTRSPAITQDPCNADIRMLQNANSQRVNKEVKKTTNC